MTKRPHEVFGWLGFSKSAHHYTDSEVGHIITAVGGVPEDNVTCKRINPDDGDFEIVEHPRRVALGEMLQTASRAYAAARKADHEPTSAQLATALRRIEKAAVKLQKAIAVIPPSDPDPITNASQSAGLRHAVIRLLSSHAHQEAETLSESHRGHADIANLGSEFLSHAVLGVDRIQRWAAEGYETERTKGTVPTRDRATGDQPLANFIGELLGIYCHIFGKTPRTSVGASGGEPSGATIKYLKACLRPVLGDDTPGGHALRARIRNWSNQT